MRRGWIIGAGVLILAGLGVIFLANEEMPAPEEVRPPPQAHERATPERAAVTAPRPQELQPVDSHPMAISFGNGSVPPENEPAALLDLFDVYRREFGSFPAGEDNPQMMHALMGRNPSGLPIFPLHHPRLDAHGALLDAWGHSFLFHSISRHHLAIRSVGPDGEIFTADDLVVPPDRP